MYIHAISFIQDLAVIMLVAAVITIGCHILKQPVVLGYIIAGIIIGPYTPPFFYISNEATIKTLAELGVIFLMFSLGLEFDLHRLKKVGLASLIAALSEIVLMMWLGYGIGIMFHWSTIDAIFLGAILAISSTTIIVKALEGFHMTKQKFSQLIFGILIIEDIFAIAILAMLSGFAIHGSFELKDIVITGIKLLSFLTFTLMLGILLIPSLISYVAKFKSREMLLILVLGLCFGFCLVVVKLDYSVALGAFIVGAVIAESNRLETIAKLVAPLKDMFSAIFFVTVGLLLDPLILVQYAFPILVITLVVVIGKVITCSLGVFLTGQDSKTSMRVGMGLAQIGEFSFIIASLGTRLNVSSRFLFPIAVAVSAITTFLTPYFIKHSDAITDALAKIVPSSVANLFNGYTTWLQNIRLSRLDNDVRKIIRRSLVQTVINLFIVMALFLAGANLAKGAGGLWLIKITNVVMKNTIIWSIALCLSLPFLIAIFRRIKGLSILLAELSVKKRINRRFPIAVRRAIAQIIPIMALIGILIFVFALSSSILPPLQLLILIGLVLIILLIFLHSWFIKIHAKLQIKFLDSMKRKK